MYIKHLQIIAASSCTDDNALPRERSTDFSSERAWKETEHLFFFFFILLAESVVQEGRKLTLKLIEESVCQVWYLLCVKIAAQRMQKSQTGEEEWGCCRCLVLFHPSQKTCYLWVLTVSCEEAVRFYVTEVTRGVRFRMGSAPLELRCCEVGPLSWKSLKADACALGAQGARPPLKQSPRFVRWQAR